MDYWTNQIFSRPSHQLIFDAIRRVIELKGHPDFVTLIDVLGLNLAEVGGENYLLQIAEYVPSPANSLYYAGIVKDKSVLRQSRKFLTDQIQAIDSGDSDSIQIVSAIQDGASALYTPPPPERTSADAANDAIDSWHMILQGNAPRGVPTYLRELDMILDPIKAGHLGVVCARPGMGKSSWMLSVAVAHAKAGGCALICSLEQPEQELVNRYVTMLTGLTEQQVKTRIDRGYNMDGISLQITEALDGWASLGIPIMDGSANSTQDIRSRVRSMTARGEQPLVFIDHLSRLRNIERGENQNLRTEERIWAIKRIALELKFLSGYSAN